MYTTEVEICSRQLSSWQRRVGKMVVRVVGRVLAGVMQRVDKLLGNRERGERVVGRSGPDIEMEQHNLSRAGHSYSGEG